MPPGTWYTVELTSRMPGGSGCGAVTVMPWLSRPARNPSLLVPPAPPPQPASRSTAPSSAARFKTVVGIGRFGSEVIIGDGRILTNAQVGAPGGGAPQNR